MSIPTLLKIHCPPYWGNSCLPPPSSPQPLSPAREPPHLRCAFGQSRLWTRPQQWVAAQWVMARGAWVIMVTMIIMTNIMIIMIIIIMIIMVTMITVTTRTLMTSPSTGKEYAGGWEEKSRKNRVKITLPCRFPPRILDERGLIIIDCRLLPLLLLWIEM